MSEDSQTQTPSGFMKWYPLALFCTIQMGTSGDNAVLSNAMSALVQTFHTTVANVQIANAMYPLIAGALMIVAGLLGLMWGWKPVLQIGLVTLVVAEVAAALSPNITVFNYVARFLAGCGASLTVPALLAYVTGIYRGKDLAVAFGAIGAATGVAGAAGPLLGGWIIVAWSWRVAFAALAALFGATFFGLLFVPGLPRAANRPRFDAGGTILVFLSLVSFTLGLLQVNEWGLVTPVHAPFTLFGISPAPLVMLAGLFLFWAFLAWEKHLEKQGRAVLFPSVFLKSRQVRAGLYMNALTFLLFGAMGFIIVTYLQIVVDYDAISTGLILMASAGGMVLFSAVVPNLYKNPPSRFICRAGILMATVSCGFLAFGLQKSATNPLLLVGLFLVGAGSGLVASQASTVIAVAIPADFGQQSGGVQGTARNLGQAIGIAVVGVVLLVFLTSSVQHQTRLARYLSPEVKGKVELVKQVEFLNNTQVEDILVKDGIPDDMRETLLKINAKGRLFAVRVSILSLALMTVLFMFGTGGLPKRLQGAAGDPGSGG